MPYMTHRPATSRSVQMCSVGSSDQELALGLDGRMTQKMSNQVDGITSAQASYDLNHPAEESKLAKENTMALSAAENEGLPSVGLGDEKPEQADRATVIEITPATNMKPVPVTDISETERKLA